MVETISLPVISIRVGMRVDLESCPSLKNDPSAEFEYAEVNYVQREAPDRLAVGYEGIDVVGYKLDTILKVRPECYKCWNCGTSVTYSDNLAFDKSDLEHARENEFCGSCQELDDFTAEVYSKLDFEHFIITKPGIISVEHLGKKWLISLLKNNDV